MSQPKRLLMLELGPKTTELFL